MRIPICFSTDHGFVMPTGVALLSILKCSEDCDLDIFILHSNSVTEADKEQLRSIVSNGNDRQNKLDLINMGEVFKDSFEIRGITHAAYYRLLLPWVLPKYDKVLYCDGDVIFKKSIKFLYNEPIGDNYCAGVSLYLYDGKTFEQYSKRIGVSPEGYVNSGVMIINLKKMRDDNLGPLFEKMANEGKYKYVDQDIINIVCEHKVKMLPFRYNVMPTMDIDEDEICIIHYAGLKPWKFFTRHWSDWWCVYRESPFYDNLLEKNIVERSHSLKQLAMEWVNHRHPSIYMLFKKLI